MKCVERARLFAALWFVILLALPAFPISLQTALAQEDDTDYDSRADEEEPDYVEDEEEEYYEEEHDEAAQSEEPADEYRYKDDTESRAVQTSPFDDSITMSENEIVTVNVLGNDRAIIGWDTAPRIVKTTEPSFGQITINSDNTITYAPSQIALPSGYEKSEVIQYTASADDISSYTGTITLWVLQVNDPPVAYSTNYTIKENVQTTFYLGAHDEDNDRLTFTMISGTEFGKSALDSNSGKLVYTPLFEFSGKETLTFQVSDGVSTSSIESIQITVDEVGKEGTVAVSDDDEPDTEEPDNASNSTAENSAPVADAGIDFDVLTEDTVTLDGGASFDVDEDSIAYTWLQTAGPEVSLAAEDTAHPSFIVPAVETQVQLSFELTVSDGNLTDSTTVIVTVLPIAIDVIPNTYPNEIVLSQPDAEIPVAIFGSSALDASGVDEDSLTLGPNSAPATRYELSDADGDGTTDHISFYRTDDLGLNPDDKTACLAGSVESQSGNTVEFEICKNVKVKLS